MGDILGVSSCSVDVGDVAPGVVGVGGNFRSNQFAVYHYRLIELDDIALQVGQAVVGIGRIADLVAQGERFALLVIDEIDAMEYTVIKPGLAGHPAVEVHILIGDAVDSLAGADIIYAVGERQGVVAAGGQCNMRN